MAQDKKDDKKDKKDDKATGRFGSVTKAQLTTSDVKWEQWLVCRDGLMYLIPGLFLAVQSLHPVWTLFENDHFEKEIDINQKHFSLEGSTQTLGISVYLQGSWIFKLLTGWRSRFLQSDQGGVEER